MPLGLHALLWSGLGDWCDANSAKGCDPSGQLTTLGVTGTSILYQDLTVLAAFASHLGLPLDAAMWTEMAASVGVAFHHMFYNATSGSYGSQAANGMARRHLSHLLHVGSP